MVQTPYYLIDKRKMLNNLQKIAALRHISGVRSLLALKCFSTWSLFDFMREYMDGTTSSSLNEVRLGHARFGKETHAYSVAFAEYEIDEVVQHADKIIFNSISQLQQFERQSAGIVRGLRLNPGVSYSAFEFADPTRPFSRLGEWDVARVAAVMDMISGFMIHNNCENKDFARFDSMLSDIEEKFRPLLKKAEWVSLGGGIHFTDDNYPLDRLSERLKRFSGEYGVQVYLEPGEASVTHSTTLEVTVLDKVYNGKELIVVDSSIEAHMLDLLIYRQNAKLHPNLGSHRYVICGKSCLAGDIFGEFDFERELNIGDRISIQDAAAYTMVKKNWFNGVKMPAIAIRELDGSVRTVRDFNYADYEQSLS
ncbi:carboxynorspermidine decarboxylase [Rhizobium leguminosarum]|uniref:carboxynorspermidine decarboxylase n=1 Tax=Rhizobium leguminosarum TaxID=384 RepID=UPI001C976DF4|nr:carboxynorspermidine decarboxylase [Rhizobium leguminosarum]MBY5775477.1 carboxynorspermidine decarboxylase [Rhizobium leguminosarum]